MIKISLTNFSKRNQKPRQNSQKPSMDANLDDTHFLYCQWQCHQ